MQHGADFYLPQGAHTLDTVLQIMLLQICKDYRTLPDPRTLRAREIRFFYEGIRPDLIEATKPRS